MFLKFPVFKIPALMLKRIFPFLRVGPISAVFMTTYECNCRCKTCNIWAHTPQEGYAPLSLEEYRLLFASMGHVWWITLGGGEPFLRPDFGQVVELACRCMKPSLVNIPSNATQPEATCAAMDMLTAAHPGIEFIINISVDHIGPEHDRIRGLDGCFEQVSKTVGMLKNLNRPNLQLGIHTVVSRHNADDFAHIQDRVHELFGPDAYIIEDAQIRDEFYNSKLPLLEHPDQYRRAVDLFLAHGKNKPQKGLFGRIKNAFRTVYYRDSLKSFGQGSTHMAPCFAGIASCQFSPEGNLFACGGREFFMGNIRKVDYKFSNLWNSKRAAQVRREIKKTRCSCRLSNAAYTNMLLTPSKLARVLLKALDPSPPKRS